MKPSKETNVDAFSAPNGSKRGGGDQRFLHDMSFDDEDDKQSIVFVLEQLLTLIRITFQTSSKIVTPALTQMMQTLVPTIQKVLQSLTPVKLHQYLELFVNTTYSIFKVVSRSTKGKEAISQLDSIISQAVFFLTSGNMRQVFVEGMGMLVKAIDSLRTPEMKALLTSLPIFLIRVVDAGASGEAKILYHSIFEFWWQIIELFGQDETTVAFAEATAKFIHILEMEREGGRHINRRRKQRRVKISGIYTRDSVRAINAKRRYQRNRYIQDTYSNRDILDDASLSGAGIEDAILSSLGEGTRTDNAWLTSLGNHDILDTDAASLPSRVILPVTTHQDNLSIESIHSASKKDDSITVMNEEQANVVDMTYLRESIKQRYDSYRKDSGVLGNSFGDNVNTTTHSIAGDSYLTLDDQCTGIEDMVNSDLVYNQSRETLLQSNHRGSDVMKEDRYRLEHEDDIIDQMHLEPSHNHVTATQFNAKANSSASHFFKTLEDLNMKYKQKIVKMKSESKVDDHSIFPKSDSKETGGTIEFKDSYAPKRFKKTDSFNVHSGDRNLSLSFSSVAKQLFALISKRNHKYIAFAVISFMFALFLWFVLGCFGIYFILRRLIAPDLIHPFKTESQDSEIIIRIVQEAGVYFNKDAVVKSAIGAIEQVVNPDL